MLFISMILSALMLLAANRIVRRARYPVAKTVGLSLAVVLGPFFLMCILPPVAIQGLLLALAVIGWRASRRGPSFFPRLSCAATLVAYGIAGWMAWQSERGYAALRARYPYESMYERLPAPKPRSREERLTAVARERLDRVEAEVEQEENFGFFRNRQLKQLHEDAVGLFINSPGFGVARMGYPTGWGLSAMIHRDPVPGQPGPRITSTWSPGEFERPPAGDDAVLGWMFEDSVKDFVFARGWGFLKDRGHVAGFVPHRFSKVPTPTSRPNVQDNEGQFGPVPEPAVHWRVRTLDLVGLLLHDEPVVYVSDHLPRMDQVRAAPTRPLDKLEALGLATLDHGEDLFISRDGDGLRMLGAIYSTKQCVACHGGERGDLLGAFSYTFQIDGKGTSVQTIPTRASLSGSRSLSQSSAP